MNSFMTRFLALAIGGLLLGHCAFAQEGGATPPPPGVSTAAQRISALKEQIIELQNGSPLGIENFSFCSQIEGYGRYFPLPNNQINQGGTLLAYYQPLNLYTARQNDLYRVYYTQDLIIETPQGQVLFNGADMLKFDYVSRAPVLDIYASNELNLGGLPPGNYVYKIILRDQIKQQEYQFSAPFTVIP